MDRLKDAWERFYRANPVAWRGPNFEFPPLKPCSRVLDVGCGPGHMLMKGAELGHRMVGLDLSPSALAIARKKLEARHLGAELIEGCFPWDVSGLGRFDCIILHHVLSSMTDRDRASAVKAIPTLLLEGGCISFLDLSVNDMRFGSGEPIEERTYLKGNGISEHFFTLDEAKELFEGYRSDDIREISWSQRTRDGPKERARITGSFYTL